MYLLQVMLMKIIGTVGTSASVLFPYWLLLCFALPKLAQERTVV
jgi:hypothetical protein